MELLLLEPMPGFERIHRYVGKGEPELTQLHREEGILIPNFTERGGHKSLTEHALGFEQKHVLVIKALFG